MQTILATALLLSFELPPEEAALAGTYASSSGAMAAELVLQPDGRYRYALRRGALAERSTGVWRVEDGVVRIDGDDATPPLITFTDAGEAPAGRIEVVLVLPDGLDASLFAIQPVGGASGAAVPIGQGGAVGLTYDPGQPPSGIRLMLPQHDIVSPVHALDLAAGGRAISISITPNDLGHVVFEDTELPIIGDRLDMARSGETLQLRRR